MAEVVALCRSLLMGVFYEFKLLIYCMNIIYFLADLIHNFGAGMEPFNIVQDKCSFPA